MLVVDASVVVRGCASSAGLAVLGDDDLHAPALMWSEARSVIRRACWWGEVDAERAAAIVKAVDACPIKLHLEAEVDALAWRVAEELGWAKTYDAEYVGLAQMLKCRLVTFDGGLLEAARELGFVVGVAEVVGTGATRGE